MNRVCLLFVFTTLPFFILLLFIIVFSAFQIHIQSKRSRRLDTHEWHRIGPSKIFEKMQLHFARWQSVSPFHCARNDGFSSQFENCQYVTRRKESNCKYLNSSFIFVSLGENQIYIEPYFKIITFFVERREMHKHSHEFLR